MAGATNKTFALRLQVDNTQQAGAAFKGLASDGKTAFKDIGDGADKAGKSVTKFGVNAKSSSEGLRSLSAVVKDGRAEFEALASRIPIIGGALKELGPAGLIGAGAFVALGAAGLKAIEAVRQTAAEIAELSNRAKQLDLPVETFQALSLKSQQAGVDINTLMEKLRNGAAQAAIGQGDLFNSLRFTNPELLKQLVAAKSLPDQFDLVAKAVQGASNQTDRINIAGGAFSKDAGPKMVQVLLEMKGGLQGYTEAAKAAGLVLDADLVKRVTEANAQFQLLDAKGKVATDQLTVAMLPAVVAVSEAFSKATVNVANFIEGFRPLTDRPLFTVNAEIEKVEAGLKEAHRELELFRTSNTVNAKEQENYLVGLIEKNQKVLSALYKAKDQLTAPPAPTGDSGKPAAENVAQEAANAQAAVAKWTAAIHAADTPAQKIRQQIDDLNADFTLGYVGVDLYAKAMAGLNAAMANQAVKDRAAVEKEAADRRAEYGDVTGLVAIKQRELNQQVKDGVRPAADVAGELAKYRAELIDANPALKAQADATKAWTDNLKTADPAIGAVVDKMDQLLLDFISGNISLDLYNKNLDQLGDALVDASVAAYAGSPEGKAALALRAENKSMLEATLTPAQKLAEEQQRMNDLVAQFPALAGDATTHMQEYAKALQQSADKGELLNATNELISEGLHGQLTGWQAVEKVALDAIDNIIQKLLEMSEAGQIQSNGGFWASLAKIIGGNSFGGGGGGGGGAGTFDAGDLSGGGGGLGGTEAAWEFHAGYQPGERNAKPRQADSSLFINAPRFHKGLQPHEKAAIVRDDEGIYSADHNERIVSAIERMQTQAAMAPTSWPAAQPTKVDVTIHNETGSDIDAQKSTKQGADGSQSIDIFLRKKVQGFAAKGDLDQSFGQRFGLKQAPILRG